MVGMSVPFQNNLRNGFIPAVMAAENVLTDKDGLTLLNDRHQL